MVYETVATSLESPVREEINETSALYDTAGEVAANLYFMPEPLICGDSAFFFCVGGFEASAHGEHAHALPLQPGLLLGGD